MGEAFVWRSPAGIWLGMNQSAPVGQPQRVERYAGLTLPPGIPVTHETLPRIARDGLDIIIGRPARCWGASMGANEAGVAGSVIRADNRWHFRSSLLKEDLLRLALMQATSAKAAVGLVSLYVERFARSGRRSMEPAVFTFADGEAIWVMETRGRAWWAQSVGHFTALTGAPAWSGDARLHSANADEASRPACLPAAMERRQRALARGLAHVINHHETGDFTLLANILRGDISEHWQHQDDAICRHGSLWHRETANSFLALLTPGERPQLWFTGSSRPCISLFKPVSWDAEPWFSRHMHFWENWRKAVRLAQRSPVIRERLIRLHAELEGQWPRFLQEDINVVIRLEQWWNAVIQILKQAP
ncbi:hypothetical protein AAIA72_13060 [Hahella sp. SMD15-11]|uniref:Membrane dipeptidase n=1 Tax=Thermohahella caldifontis TaxID=3142973 RepID=A0AB39UUI9_9GAMM